jgi:hypothetical protein
MHTQLHCHNTLFLSRSAPGSCTLRRRGKSTITNTFPTSRTRCDVWTPAEPREYLYMSFPTQCHKERLSSRCSPLVHEERYDTTECG